MGETRREKREDKKVSVKESSPRRYPREFQFRFWSRERPKNACGPLFKTIPCSLSPPLSRSRSFSLALSLLFSRSLFPFTTISVRLSPRSVREPSHSQKTQNADGHVSRRHRSAGGEGPEEEGGEQRCARVCVWVSVCVCYGARRFTDYILTVLRRFRYTDRRRWEFCYFGTAFLAMSTNRDRSVIK